MQNMSRLECRYVPCKQGLIDRTTAIKEQKAQIRHGVNIPKRKRLSKLSLEETSHLLNYHSPKQVRVRGGPTTKVSNMSTYFSRRPDKNMAFACICGKEFWARIAIKRHYEKYCAQNPIPPGYPGISFASTRNHAQVDHDDYQEAEEAEEDEEDEDEEEDEEDEDEEEDEEDEDEEEDEEDEDDADEAAISSSNTNRHRSRSASRSSSSSSSISSTARSFGSEFAKAVETTRCLQKQSLDLHQKTIQQLMELHQTAKEHILQLRQELQEERSTRRLALQALMETQAAHQEERQEWTVERLSLLAHLETQQQEHQENKERINSIESRLKRSIMALGDDNNSTAPYRTPPTSEDSPVFTKPVVFPG